MRAEYLSVAAPLLWILLMLLSLPAFAESDWRDTETAEIAARGDILGDERVYVSNETMQKMTEARGWNVRELPDSWRGYIRTSNILYAGLDTPWPEITRPEREADRTAILYGDTFEFWSVPAAPFEFFYSIRVFYINENNKSFYLELDAREWDITQSDRLLENGISPLGAIDNWIHYYSVDNLHPVPVEGGARPQHLTYKIGASGGHMDEQDIIDFLSSLP